MYCQHRGGANAAGGTWNRACPWCGRGGNLHLDSADPNCRCQQDSVLVTTMHLGQPNLVSNEPNFGIGGGKQMPPGVRRHSKHVHKNMRNAVSVTPTNPLMVEGVLDSKEEVCQNDMSSRYDVPERPGSAQSIDQSTSFRQAKAVKAVHQKMTKSVGLGARPSDNIMFSHQYHFQHQQQQYLQQPHPQSIAFSYSPTGWQSLITHQQQQQQQQQPYYSPLHPLYHQHGSPRRSEGSRGLQGAMYTTRVKNVLSHKSAPPSSMVKLWSNTAYLESDHFVNPLTIVAQRRLRLKQPK